MGYLLLLRGRRGRKGEREWKERDKGRESGGDGLTYPGATGPVES